MVRVNHQYFVVRINKKLQKEKRDKLVSKDIGYLGVKHSEQDDDDKLNGVRVWDVDKDSPAWDAGFKSNDIITKVHHVPVNSYSELVDQLSKYKPGEEIYISYINSFSVDREHQTMKQVTLGARKMEVFLPPQIIDFQFNLQFGEIIQVGKIAEQQFPDAKVGDVLIFHHAVEHKPRPDGDKMYNDFHLIETDENGDEYRIVNFTTELFGVWKMNEGRIIPYEKYIFCHYNIRKASMQQTESGLWFADAWEKSIDELQAQIDEIKNHITEITSSTMMKERDNEENYRKKEEAEKTIRLLTQEARAITKKMNQKRLVELTALFVHPKTCEELQVEIKAGDTLIADWNILYPLDLFGQHYTLIRKEYVEAIIFNNQKNTYEVSPQTTA